MTVASTLSPPRRVVTTTKADGKASVWIDEPVEMMAPGTKGAYGVVWQTDKHLADVQTTIDGATLPKNGIVQRTGSTMVFVDFAPGASDSMHFTNSIDYAVVLAGEIMLDLSDGSKTPLRAGDAVVQMGTAHGWHNRQDDWCRIMFVTLPAQPILIDGEPLEEIHRA